MGTSKLPGLSVDDDAVLKSVHSRDIVRVVGVDEDAHGDGDVAGADLIAGEGVFALVVDDRVRVVVLVDHLHRHEPVAGVGQCHSDRSRIEVEHGGRIESVAVGPDDELMVDGGQFAKDEELPEAVVFRDLPK